MIAKRSVENMPDLSGKTAIVTGANGGIGYEIARALASKQATTILACRNEEKGETAVHHINHGGFCTTATDFCAGIPMLVIPHIIDQSIYHLDTGCPAIRLCPPEPGNWQNIVP
jgi:NAD(P)-dependent dehydrogenase (short-subunit alcohol dehydrogenase family)